MKVCSKCGHEKSLAAFAKCSRAKDGRQYCCKECGNALARAYRRTHWREQQAYNARFRKNHREEQRAYDARYREEHSEEIRANKTRYREEHVTERNMYNARYYKEHAETIRKQKVRYYRENTEKLRTRARQYYWSCPEERRLYVSRYQSTHPEQHREHARQRRARKRAVSENFTVEMEQIVRATWSNRCAFCDATKDLQIDHWKPLSRGHALTVDNAVLLCRACNARKGAKLPEELDNQTQVVVVEKQLAEQAQQWLARELVASFFAA